MPDKKTVQFIHPCLTEIGEIKICYPSVFLFFRIIDNLWDKCVNVRIPVKCSSECMDCGNHAKNILVFEVAVKVVIIFFIAKFTAFLPLPLFLPVNWFIKNLA